MEEISTEIKAFERKLAEPNFYNKDAKGFNDATAQLEKLIATLADKEEQWLELELLREETE